MGQSIPTLVGRVKGSTPLFSTIALLNPGVNRDLQGNRFNGVLFYRLEFWQKGQSIPTMVGRVKGSTPLFSTIALRSFSEGGSSKVNECIERSNPPSLKLRRTKVL